MLSTKFIQRLILLVLAVSLMQSAFAREARNPALARTDAPATEQRVALVIGNSAYKTSPLKNPVNDAKAMSAKLKALGFNVIERENLTQEQIGSVLREFRSKLKPGAVALFFYAGHGLQVKGVNYLPAVDADIASEEDVPIQSLNMNHVLELMDEAKTRMNLVFLDACRNNPYARSLRSASSGLAKVTAPSGTIISFATRPGSVAADGSGKNGLYTGHLLANMDLPQPVEQVLKRVVSGVKQASKGRQEPWMEGSIEGDFYFKPPSAQPAAVPVQQPVGDGPGENAATEVAYWNSVKDSNRTDLLAYLDKYPDGQFAALAKNRVNRIQQDMVALISAQPKLYTAQTLPLTSSDIPILYEHTAQILKGKATNAQLNELLAAYRQDAETDDAVAQFSLGSMYRVGLGIQQDDIETYKWQSKAAEAGLAAAQTNVGNAYIEGKAVAKDEAEAVKWYRKSAEQGEAIAQYALGAMYAEGRGVAKDEAEAARWYRKAVEQGYAAAQYNLDIMYANGQGIAKGETEAVDIHPQAADPDAMELVFWDSIKNGNDTADYQAYLDKYPAGHFAELARNRIKRPAVESVGISPQQPNANIPPAAAVHGLAPGTVFRDCPECPEMVVVPAGKFTLGSPSGEEGRSSDEGPQHEVVIAAPFAVGKFEVTFEQWEACAAAGGCNSYHPSDYGSGRGTRPVIYVSWDDAKAYVKWLRDKSGKSYRLLSEAEWEYAARAGTTTARYWGESPEQACTYANVNDMTGVIGNIFGLFKAHLCNDGYSATAPVGSFQPNAFGLYDMLGNVLEWVEDCWHENYHGAPTDGSVWQGGDCTKRGLRGATWNDGSRDVRAAARFKNNSTIRTYLNGFRVARTLP